MTDRRDTADRHAGGGAHGVGVGSTYGTASEQRGDLGGVDPVCTAGEHEQRCAISGEDQAVGDRSDLATELCGCGRGCRRWVAEMDHRSGRAGRREDGGDVLDGPVHAGRVHAARLSTASG